MGKKLKNGLTAKEELFCQLFSKLGTEYFGNGTRSYVKAFSTSKKVIGYRLAATYAYDLLKKPYIYKRVNDLLKIYVDDNAVDAQTGAVIYQWADMSAKVAAIREYNRVKGRLAATKFKFVDENDDLTDEELKKQIATRTKKS